VNARFGPFVLDSGRRTLTRDGDEIDSTLKAFDRLVLLVDEAPRVVRKTASHERLCPGTFVSDATLVGLVKEPRRALNDREASAPIIRTAHGRGLRVHRADRPGHVVGPDPVGGLWRAAVASPCAKANTSSAVIQRPPDGWMWRESRGIRRGWSSSAKGRRSKIWPARMAQGWATYRSPPAGVTGSRPDPSIGGAERTGHMAMSREEQIDALHRAALQRDKRERPALLPGGRVGPGIAGVRLNHCSHSRVGCAAIDWSLARRTSSRAE
jgi:hypothetical protein